MESYYMARWTQILTASDNIISNASDGNRDMPYMYNGTEWEQVGTQEQTFMG